MVGTISDWRDELGTLAEAVSAFRGSVVMSDVDRCPTAILTMYSD